MILICDGFKLTKLGKKPRMKGGLVSQQIADGYAEVLTWLRQQTKRPGSLLAMVPRLELLEMKDWRGSVFNAKILMSYLRVLIFC